MQPESSTTAERTQRPRWERSRVAAALAAYENAAERGVSQREFAASIDVPRTTLQHWLARKAGLDDDPVVVAFLESPSGLAFLHRLVGALHFLFGQVGLNGINLLCRFLELTGLDAVVAGSQGAQHGVAAAMTESIGAFGREQRALQAGAMPHRIIALAEDETFPEGVWLVAMEPVSGFVQVEESAEDRKAATWTAAVRKALADLWVTVLVTGADEASALASHAAEMGAHLSPDVFHVQNPLWRAVARPLHKSLERPQAILDAAVKRTQAWHERWAKHRTGPRAVGRPPNFPRHVAAAEAAEAQARAGVAAAEERKERTHAAIRTLSTAYHPVDSQTGERRGAATVAAELDAAMATIRDTAAALHIGSMGRDLIEKAGRVVPKMVATIDFFYAELGRQLAAQSLPAAAVTYAEAVLMPAAYLSRLAARAPTVADRNALEAARTALLARADPEVLALLTPFEWTRVERVVLTCVDLFVRSTSCVEGRNGRLALWHHHLHRLSDKRLTALTVIHNYWIRRADGSTAAERFFEVPHADLFEWLLDHMDLPARPTATPARAQAA